MKITFFGAAEQVTGSRYLVENEGTKVLVECGMFQGDDTMQRKNWDPFPVDPKTIDVVVLTHAHIDHSGYVPVLIKNGFKGKVYCSEGTFQLCSILFPDGGRIQEREAKEVKEEGYCHSCPPVPLYTENDAIAALHQFKVIEFNTPTQIGSLSLTLIMSGHIIGSSFVVLSNGSKTLTFSGDLGRPDQYIMKPPIHLEYTDYLVVESTYGNRLHGTGDTMDELQRVIKETVAKGGVLLIPAFAVARTQSILYCLYQLKHENKIPDVPIFLDSPAAIKVTDLMCHFNTEHTIPPYLCNEIFNVAAYTPTAQESKKLGKMKHSAIIVAGSGMANGGRIIHHFKRYISDPKNTVLFVGYQADDTNGRALVEGADKLKIHGKAYTVRADIKTINTLSAHADYGEILEWLSFFKKPIKKVFVTHGELEAAVSLQKKIEDRFGWSVVVPKYTQSYDLD